MTSDIFTLAGQTALVTGGSRGLGLQIAEALGEAGAKIMLTSRKAGDLEEAAALLQDKGIDARWIAADASQPADIQRVAKQYITKETRAVGVFTRKAADPAAAASEDPDLAALPEELKARGKAMAAQVQGEKDIEKLKTGLDQMRAQVASVPPQFKPLFEFMTKKIEGRIAAIENEGKK